MRTEDLLHLTPEGAIVAMVNYENRTIFRPDSFDFGKPQSLGGTLTRIRLTARASRGITDTVPDPGWFDFEYHRLDINKYFEGMLNSYRPRMPTSTKVLVEELSARMNGQEFYEEDFLQDYIDRENGEPYRLKAGPDSLRWVGETNITLGHWPDLAVYLAGAAPNPYHQVPETRELVAQPIGFSYINATVSLPSIAALPMGVPFQNNAGLVALVADTINRPPHYATAVNPDWVVDPQPRAFNLYNAVIVDKALDAATAPWKHPSNPNLNKLVWIRLDLNYCTNFTERDVYLPYQSDPTPLSSFSDLPRMKNSGVVSPSDASAWNKLFNGYQIGQTLSGWPAGGLMINGDVPWFTNASAKGRTNLYGALVQYNGQRRTSDLKPATPGLNRVLVLTVDETFNTTYQGQLSIHYKAPILVTETAPNGKVGTAYSFPLAPTDGTAPYTLTATGLPPGLTISGTTVQGTPTTAGGYNPVFTVKDSTNTSVVYQIRITIAP
ncbi:Ig domain-containing protein [Stenotrophomonas sp. GD03657]|uniref:Ig domain-containing protein n=1 Tax=Stenotrophomonas sp. GD03657 TaxID=2975363 RepID=UPI002446A7C7|nr:Ig domain-containing protein [Stenotrophomonas sp. GD03657]MDH2154229.1 Ig domain-containing protein [Stenotrophomonas sp. GD03657]